MLTKSKPELDVLARSIPADQHAVFFPAVDAAVQLARRASNSETVILRLAEPRSEESCIRDRYERQFCLNLERLATILKHELAQSVALTGSDPHVSMGTDVAVLIESTDPKAVSAVLIDEVSATAKRLGDAEKVKSEIEGITYEGFRSPDRRISSYVATLDSHVVTNSLP